VCFFITIVLTSFTTAAEPEFFYYYRGAKKPLELNQSELVVKVHPSPATGGDAARAAGFAASSSALGYKAEDGKPFHTEGWIKLNTTGAGDKIKQGTPKTKPEQLRRLLDDLIKRDEVEFAAPLFKDAKGRPINFTATILVGFVDGTSDAVQLDTLKKILHTKSPRQHGRKNMWAVTTSYRNGLDLMEVANALALLPFVRYAEPNFVMPADLL